MAYFRPSTPVLYASLAFHTAFVGRLEDRSFFTATNTSRVVSNPTRTEATVTYNIRSLSACSLFHVFDHSSDGVCATICTETLS